MTCFILITTFRNQIFYAHLDYYSIKIGILINKM